jgi:hypothetical protein
MHRGRRHTDPSCPPPSRGQALALFDPDDHALTIDIGELQRYDLRCAQAGGIGQAQGRLVLDVRRRCEKPTDLFRAENSGEAARLGVMGHKPAQQRDRVLAGVPSSVRTVAGHERDRVRSISLSAPPFQRSARWAAALSRSTLIVTSSMRVRSSSFLSRGVVVGAFETAEVDPVCETAGAAS